MNKTMLRISRLLITVLMVSALIFTGCSCSDKKGDKETTKVNNKGVAATIVNEDGSVEYVEDIVNDGKNNANNDNEDDIGSIVDSKDGKKANSNKSGSTKANSKNSSAKKSNGKNSNSTKKSNGNSSKSGSSKKSDSKKSDSDKKSDDKEKTTKKSNFVIEKGDDDNRFGPIIRGKKKK